MLFRHHTHSTAFSLTVDDLLVRYSHPSELDHLDVSCLSNLYELKVHRDSPRNTYLGYTIDYSPSSPSPPCMTLSMPNYIPAMLSHLSPSGCGSASSPRLPSTLLPLPTPTRLHPPPLHHHLSRLQKKTVSNGWLDPCFSMHEPLTYPSSLPFFNSPRTNPTPPNLTSLPLTAHSTTSPPIPTPTKLFIPHPWLSGPAPTPVTCLDLSQAV